MIEWIELRANSILSSFWDNGGGAVPRVGGESLASLIDRSGQSAHHLP